MSFILGQSRLTYDHFGDYVNVQSEAIAQHAFGVVGDSCLLGEGSLGTFTMGEDTAVIEVLVEVL